MRPWVALLALVASSCGTDSRTLVSEIHPDLGTREVRSANAVFQGALRQLEKPARYDARYQRISYPGGDVPVDRGACADVVVRALRFAGQDLQQLIHRDSQRCVYPGIKTRDPNIDHRRVFNQEVYFRRHAQVLTATDPWLPGDIVSWRLPNGQGHIGVVSDRKNAKGDPLVIHNIRETAEDDVLRSWKIVGHFRVRQ